MISFVNETFIFRRRKNAFKKVTSIVLGSLLILGLSGCGMSQAKKKEVTSDKLVVQFVPTNNDGSMEAKTKPFAEYLSKN